MTEGTASGFWAQSSGFLFDVCAQGTSRIGRKDLRHAHGTEAFEELLYFVMGVLRRC
jgi:hypothetical protein